ncbi:MAG: tRNA lysidine(34) synthetase TilS [Bacteroidales bacterium]|nr:tRNA lysidine(34) synthetase TilS [Bacteroidales bacterium]
MSKDIYEIFLKHISSDIPDYGSRKYLLAVSGGLDSMTMWELFTRAGFQVIVAHVNYQLRGQESEEDELLVRKISSERNQPVFVKHIDLHSFAQQHGLSIQIAARKVRYDFFKKILEQEKADFICTAHHKDDLIETFFIALHQKGNLFKLTGFQKISDYIYRPLLNFSRKELESYAYQRKIIFRNDRSNQQDIYQRNIWRNHILPKIDFYFPNFRQNFYQSLNYLRETSSFLKYAIHRELEFCMIDDRTLNLNKLRKHPFSIWLLKQFLLSMNGDPNWAEKILSSSLQPRRFIKNGNIFYIHHDFLYVEKLDQTTDSIDLYYIDEDLSTSHLPFFLEATQVTIQSLNEIPRNPYQACMDMSKLQFPILVRKWKAGDYFQPLGMKGQKKVSDFLTDSKIPIWERNKTYVMISNHHIIWVIGLRISQQVAIQEVPSQAILWNYKNI